MRTKLSDWKNGWYGITLEVTSSEVDRLIELLKRIQADPEQHFHLSSEYKDEGGVGDIEISLQAHDSPSNMILFGTAMGAPDHDNA